MLPNKRVKPLEVGFKPPELFLRYPLERLKVSDLGLRVPGWKPRIEVGWEEIKARRRRNFLGFGGATVKILR